MISETKELSIRIKDNFVYHKLRHKPTGLFYRPTSYRFKSNLSKTGKIYVAKPVFTLREGPLSFFKDLMHNKHPIILDDWEIIIYKVKIQGIEAIPKELDYPVNERKRSTDNSTTNSAQKSILENLKNAIKPKAK